MGLFGNRKTANYPVPSGGPIGQGLVDGWYLYSGANDPYEGPFPTREDAFVARGDRLVTVVPVIDDHPASRTNPNFDRILGGGGDAKYQARKVAHDSGDGETIYHCPFCGGGQVTGRSDGTVECGYCQKFFTVQVQPTHPGTPQTIDGQPYENPEMPGTPGEQVGAEEAATGPEVAAGATSVDPVTGEPWAGGEAGGVDPVTGKPWAAPVGSPV